MAKLLQVKIKWFRIEKIDPLAELVLPHISFCRVPGGKASNDPLESNETKNWSNFKFWDKAKKKW